MTRQDCSTQRPAVGRYRIREASLMGEDSLRYVDVRAVTDETGGGYTVYVEDEMGASREFGPTLWGELSPQRLHCR